MKILISEKQLGLITENQLQYTDEKLVEFFKYGKNYLNKLIKAKQTFVNQVLFASINDVIENQDNFVELQTKIANTIATTDGFIEKLYGVLDTYEVTDRPELVSNLEYDVVNIIENVRNDLDDIKNVLDDLITHSGYIKKLINP